MACQAVPAPTPSGIITSRTRTVRRVVRSSSSRIRRFYRPVRKRVPIRRFPRTARKQPIKRIIKALLYRRPKRAVYKPPPPPPPMLKPPAKAPVPNQVAFNESLPVAKRKMYGAYNPVKLRGFSDVRPEILSVLHFVPAYDNGARYYQRNSEKYILPAGEKIRVQFSLAKLRDKNMQEIIGVLREDDAAKREIEIIENGYDTKVRQAETDIKILASLFVMLQKTGDALNIRKSQPKIMAGVAAQAGTSVEPASYTSLLMSLGFSKENISEFSNTKILMQLLYDMGIALSQFSPLLLDIPNPDRADDDDPIEIDKAVLDPTTEVFSLESIRGADKGGGSRRAFWKLAAMLFNSIGDSPIMTPDNRIRFLVSSLVKDMRFSCVLGSNEGNIALWRRNISADEGGNVFDDLLGIPGNTITEPVAGINSLCQLLRRESGDDTIILPFESDIFSEEDASYISGKEFFVDAILAGQSAGLGNTGGLNAFINEATNMGSSTDTIIDLFSGQKVATSSLLQVNRLQIGLYWNFMPWIDPTRYTSEASVINAGNMEVHGENTVYNITIALLGLSYRHEGLKMLLYYYTILLGLSNLNNPQSAFRHPYWQSLAESDIRLLRQIPPLAEEFKGNGPQNKYATTNGTYQPALDYIVHQIVETVKSILPPSSKPASAQTWLSEAACEYLLKQTGVPLQRNIFARIGQVMAYLHSSAKSGHGIVTRPPERTYTLNDGSHRTRFGQMRPAFLLAMVFEIFASMGAKYGSSVSFVSSGTTSSSDDLYFYIGANLDMMRGTYDAMMTAAKSGTDYSTNKAKARNKTGYALTKEKAVSALLANLSAMEADEDLPLQISNYLTAIFANLKRESSGLLDFFPSYRSRKGSSAFSNQRRLRELMGRTDAGEMFATLNPAQLATSVHQIWSLKRTRANPSSGVSAFTNPTYLSSDIQQALLSMLREPMFRRSRAENLKIVSVGLPAGIGASLASPVLQDDDNPGPVRERDVVQINVYKRDLEFDDIVFKPMSFLFEMSRFVSAGVFGVKRAPRGGIARMRFLPHAGKSIVANHSKTVDFQIDEDFVFPAGWQGIKAEGYHSVAKGSDYSFLNTDEKREMFKNHMLSFYLELYIRFMTDMEVREETFLLNDTVAAKKADEADRQRFIKLMLTRISALAGRPVSMGDLRKDNPQMDALLTRLDDPDRLKGSTHMLTGLTEKIETHFTDLSSGTNIEMAEELVAFVKTFSPQSLLTGASITVEKILSPKIFERIFHIPVDIDNFEIDVESTRATAAGKRAWKDKAFQETLVRNKKTGIIKMKARNAANGDHVSSELFVTLSTKALEEDIS